MGDTRKGVMHNRCKLTRRVFVDTRGFSAQAHLRLLRNPYRRSDLSQWLETQILDATSHLPRSKLSVSPLAEGAVRQMTSETVTDGRRAFLPFVYTRPSKTLEGVCPPSL